MSHRADVSVTLLVADQMAEKNKLMVSVVGLTAGGVTVSTMMGKRAAPSNFTQSAS